MTETQVEPKVTTDSITGGDVELASDCWRRIGSRWAQHAAAHAVDGVRSRGASEVMCRQSQLHARGNDEGHHRPELGEILPAEDVHEARVGVGERIELAKSAA